jgi:hypothetical protein
MQTLFRLPILLLAVVACCFCACEREITPANLKYVKPDMTSKEVESILGAPTRIVTVSEPSSEAVKTLPVVRYVYEQKGKNIELTFVGDRLVDPNTTGTIRK